MDDHISLVREVLKRLKENGLVLKESKCYFHIDRFVYLGHVITKEGISMDPEKTRAIIEYPAPQSVKEIRSFLGMANYYRKFIPNYSDHARPLTDLTKKGVGFTWKEEAAEAFKNLKLKIASDVKLRHPDLGQPFVICTDASDFAIAAVLIQHDNSKNLRPLEYYSRKLNTSEWNYSVHDKELLAVKEALEEWRHYVLYSKEPVKIFCDHKNLLQFKDSRLL